MKGIVIHTTSFDPFAPGSMFRTKMEKSDYALRHYVVNVSPHRAKDPELHQSFVLCDAPTAPGKNVGFDLDVYHTMFDQERIISFDDLMYPYPTSLSELADSWIKIRDHKPSEGNTGVVITDQIDRQFLLEDHESGMLEDFNYLFDSMKIQYILTVEPRPFGVEIPGIYILAAKMFDGDWQSFYHFTEPKRFKCTVVG